MEEMLWAVVEAQAWVAKHGGRADGLSRQTDGRWFLRVITCEHVRGPFPNMTIAREADLGRFPSNPAIDAR